MPQIRESILADIEHELDMYERVKKLRAERLEIANKLLQEQSDIDQEIERACSHEYTTGHTDPVTAKTEYQCDVCEEWI